MCFIVGTNVVLLCVSLGNSVNLGSRRHAADSHKLFYFLLYFNFGPSRRLQDVNPRGDNMFQNTDLMKQMVGLTPLPEDRVIVHFPLFSHILY